MIPSATRHFQVGTTKIRVQRKESKKVTAPIPWERMPRIFSSRSSFRWTQTMVPAPTTRNRPRTIHRHQPRRFCSFIVIFHPRRLVPPSGNPEAGLCGWILSLLWVIA